MKKIQILTLLVFGLLLSEVSAQDVIVLRDATEIEAKVLEIQDSKITYKKFENLNGPIYSKNIEEILFIKYENGSKDVFNNATDYSPVKNKTISNTNKNVSNNNEKKIKERPFIKRPRFQSYIGLATHFGENFSVGPTASFGVRIFDYGYVGFQTGAQFMLERWRYEYATIPFLLDIKGYFPINRKVHPFIEYSGGGLLVTDFYDATVLTTEQIGLGFDIKHFSISFGYQSYKSYYYGSEHGGYIKISGTLFKDRK